MNIKKVFIVLGEPNSVFSEILFKYFISNQFKKNKKKIIVIGCKNLLKEQMRVLGYNLILNEIIETKYASHKLINIINIDYKFKSAFTKISTSSNNYIKKCFDLSINLLKNNKHSALINGPISKTHFLKKKISRYHRIRIT